ncbi:hypothetical protein FKM82_000012 [Ascaphus truei]
MSIWTLLPPALTMLLCNMVYMQGTGNRAMDCCLQTSDIRIPYGAVLRYEIQDRVEGCQIPAVVFFTKTSMRLCASPGLDWVKKLMRKLNQKKIKDPKIIPDKKVDKSKKEKKGRKQKNGQKKTPQPQNN